jgi:hypothetical protein
MEYPLLCQTEMVQAIGDGRKTQTRRICKDKSLIGFLEAGFSDEFILDIDNFDAYKSPYGKAGDYLWVREAFCIENYYPDNDIATIRYKAGGMKLVQPWGRGWVLPEVIGKPKPSIHLPRVANRYLLRNNDVSLQRLQDISETDAINEGVKPIYDGDKNLIGYENYLPYGYRWFTTAKESFQSLWIKIHGEGSWEQNPIVWAVYFEKKSDATTHLSETF